MSTEMQAKNPLCFYKISFWTLTFQIDINDKKLAFPKIYFLCTINPPVTLLHPIGFIHFYMLPKKSVIAHHQNPAWVIFELLIHLFWIHCNQILCCVLWWGFPLYTTEIPSQCYHLMSLGWALQRRVSDFSVCLVSSVRAEPLWQICQEETSSPLVIPTC